MDTDLDLDTMDPEKSSKVERKLPSCSLIITGLMLQEAGLSQGQSTGWESGDYVQLWYGLTV